MLKILPITLSELEADPVPHIETVRSQLHDLCWGGFRQWSRQIEDKERFERMRREMTEPYGIGQVLRAARFIDRAPKIASLNRKRSTYGWKHVVERDFRRTNTVDDYYVGEGSFITAAILLGVTVARTSVGRTYAGLSERAAKDQQPPTDTGKPGSLPHWSPTSSEEDARRGGE